MVEICHHNTPIRVSAIFEDNLLQSFGKGSALSLSSAEEGRFALFILHQRPVKKKEQDAVLINGLRLLCRSILTVALKKMITVESIEPFITPEATENFYGSKLGGGAGAGQLATELTAGEGIVNRSHGDNHLPGRGACLLKNMLHIGRRDSKSGMHLKVIDSR